MSMFNARSLVNKVQDLHCLLASHRYDVVCVTETWLRDDVDDCILIGGTEYSIYRKDRCDRVGGGVCVFVNNRTVKSVRVSVQQIYVDLELLAIDVFSDTGKFRLVVCYRPPTSSETDIAAVAYTKLLCDCIESLNTPNSTLLLCGDLNFPKIKWSNANHILSNINTCSGLFLNLYYKYAFKQFVEEATRISHQNTRNGSILDVIFSNDSNFVYNVDVVEPFSTSDHCIVNFDVVSAISCAACDKLCFDYSRADWNEMRNFLDNVDFFYFVLK